MVNKPDVHLGNTSKIRLVLHFMKLPVYHPLGCFSMSYSLFEHSQPHGNGGRENIFIIKASLGLNACLCGFCACITFLIWITVSISQMVCMQLENLQILQENLFKNITEASDDIRWGGLTLPLFKVFSSFLLVLPCFHF